MQPWPSYKNLPVVTQAAILIGSLREATRFQWSPSEVSEFKDAQGLLVEHAPLQASAGSMAEVSADQRWPGLTNALGTAIFSMDASEGALQSVLRSGCPTGLISPDGDIVGFWGGGAEVTPRDVAVSADGRSVYAGYSLLGRIAGYSPDGERFAHRAPIVFSSGNPYKWDTFKDSDRQLGISPDNRTVIAIASAEEGGIIAYDANSGQERWRLERASAPSRPRGDGHPQVAFSPDSQRVLLVTRVEEAAQQATIEVTERRWNADDRKYNKKDTFTNTYTRRAVPSLRQLMLVDVATGRPVWTETFGYELIDTETRSVLWAPGKEPQIILDDPHQPGRTVTWKCAKDATPTVGGRAVSVPEMTTIPFWHLYSAVGPQGQWSIASTRDAKFSPFDDKGVLLRTWEPRHLPRELDPGSMIPPSFIAANDPDRVLAFAPQSRALFMFRIAIGSQQVRDRARQAELANLDAMNRIRGELRNTKNYGNYSKNDYLDAFIADIGAVPAELRQELRERMARVPQERRAGRKRDIVSSKPWSTASTEHCIRKTPSCWTKRSVCKPKPASNSTPCCTMWRPMVV